MRESILVIASAGVLIGIVAVLAGGGTSTDSRSASYYAAPPEVPADAKLNRVTGLFELFYSSPEDGTLSGVYNTVKQQAFFGSIVKDLNGKLRLPVNIIINFTQCGKPDAFYDPSTKAVSICYEFMNSMENLYRAINVTDDARMASVANAEFVLYHEIGHALIDTLDLPITGREEDAADQLAMLMVLSKTQPADAPAVFTAYALAFQSANQNPSDLLWDEHSLDGQRFYNIVCWLYGQNPEKYQSAISGVLPQERAQRCIGEYSRMLSSWARLLQPFRV